MTINLQHLAIILGAFFLGGFVVWLFMRSRMNLIIQNEQSQLTTEIKLSQQKQEKITENFVKLHKNNKKLEQKNQHLIQENKSLATNFAVTEQRLKQQLLRIDELQQDISQLNKSNTNAAKRHTESQTIIAELQTLNTQQEKTSNEKIALLTEAREEFKNQFMALANEIFDEKGRKFSQNNKEKLDSVLAPFNKHLHDFKQTVNDVYINEAKQRASLKTEIQGLRTLNQQLNKEAINLTRALKGDKKLQGNWGELILERVLEQSGLRKGQEYKIQSGFRDNDNNILKPDVIVYLPQGKDIIIDSKVSLTAFENYTSAHTEEEQNIALTDHIKAIQNHIKTLRDKDYSNLKGVKSLDLVLMFIPIEPAFLLAFQHSDKLFSEAFNSKIIVVTPTTLLATLKTIENLWRYEKQNQNACDIADKAGHIYDKFRGFIEDIEKLGKQIDTTQTTFHDALNKLTTGKGNLVSQAQQLLDLGIKVKKEIPKTMLEKSDLHAMKLESHE